MRAGHDEPVACPSMARHHPAQLLAWPAPGGARTAGSATSASSRIPRAQEQLALLLVPVGELTAADLQRLPATARSSPFPAKSDMRHSAIAAVSSANTSTAAPRRARPPSTALAGLGGAGAGQRAAVAQAARGAAAFDLGLGGHGGSGSDPDAVALTLGHAVEDEHDQVRA